LGSGCFWSKEYYYARLPGVLATAVGFSGGHQPDPTYRQVCGKQTGHAEVVAVWYDRRQLPPADLLRHFFANHNPAVDRRERGGQYRSLIGYTTEAQRQAAERMLARLRHSGRAVYTELVPAGPFYPAGSRHQQYCDARGITPRERRGIPLSFWATMP
jgi:methionine-S-sulfoxide reductase